MSFIKVSYSILSSQSILVDVCGELFSDQQSCQSVVFRTVLVNCHRLLLLFDLRSFRSTQ